MECYIAPTYTLTMEDDIVDTVRRSQESEVMVEGDLNADLTNPEGTVFGRDCSGTGDLWVIRHEQPFPTKTQTSVKGWAYMEHAVRRYVVALLH